MDSLEQLFTCQLSFLECTGHYIKVDPNHHIASQLRARFQKNVVVYVGNICRDGTKN